MVLDFESNTQGTSMTLDEARPFITRGEAATGRVPGLYSGEYVKGLLGTKIDPVLGHCWFGLSQYGPAPVVPANWKRWTMWQYTDGAAGPEPHTVDGIGRCDRNTFSGDVTELRSFWG